MANSDRELDELGASLKDVDSTILIELLRRRGLHLSVWSARDLDHLAENSDLLATVSEDELSHDDIEPILVDAFQNVADNGFLGHLATKGNEFIDLAYTQEQFDAKIAAVLAAKRAPRPQGL